MNVKPYSPYLYAKKKKNELKKKKAMLWLKIGKKYLEIYKISQKNYIVV